MQQLVICFRVFETPLAAAVYRVVISCSLSAANENIGKHVDDKNEGTSATRRRHFVDCGNSSRENCIVCNYKYKSKVCEHVPNFFFFYKLLDLVYKTKTVFSQQQFFINTISHIVHVCTYSISYSVILIRVDIRNPEKWYIQIVKILSLEKGS